MMKKIIFFTLLLFNMGIYAQDFPDPYCDITMIFDVEEITMVEFGDTEITNDNSLDALINKTSTVVDVTPGETYTIVVKGYTGGDYDNDITAFIDWDQNSVLDDEGEVFPIGVLTNSSGHDNVSVTAEITVPEDAAPGETRIRITKVYGDEEYFEIPIEDPCAISLTFFGDEPESSFGQALDFTLNVLSDGEELCEAPENITVEDITENSASVTWESEDNEAWEVMYGPAGFDIDGEESVVVETDETMLEIEGLNADAEYDVYVRTICDTDNASNWEGPVSFTTEDSQEGDFPDPYCDITDPDIEIDKIDLIEFDETLIENENSSDIIVDKTSTIVNVHRGQTYTINADGVPDGLFYIKFVGFVDWNQNESLDDEGEVYDIGTISGSDNTDNVTVSYNITIPQDAQLGETRIRITKTFGDPEFPAVTDPCNIAIEFPGLGIVGSLGQALDFTLNVLEGEEQDCEAPENIAIEDITENSASVTWDSEDNEAWEVMYGPAGFDIDGEEGVAVETDETMLEIEGLDAETEYDVYVRTICDTDNASNWEGPVSFTTEDSQEGGFPDPYCDIDDPMIDVEAITSVEFDDTVIENDNDTDVLVDYTSTVINVEQGQTYTLKVEGFTDGDFDNYIVAFIDWNQNEILDDGGEVYEVGVITNSSGDDGVSASIDITVPEDALIGETRIRITKTYGDEDSPAIIDPCSIVMDAFGMGAFASYGQAIDFTLNIEEGEDIDEDFPSPYCDIDDPMIEVEAITSVEFDGTVIENDNVTDVLVDYTSTVINVEQGQTYTLNVEGFTDGNFDNYIVAFIDWNQNEILDDEGEVYEVGVITNSSGDDGVSASIEITVPEDAMVGETRIRITKTYGDEDSPAIIDPCSIVMDAFGMGAFASYGQAIDFTLDVGLMNVNRFDESALTVYPIPTDNFLNIVYQSELKNVKIYNLLGQEVISENPNTPEAKIDVSNLAEGMYIVRLNTEEGTHNFRFVKK